VLAPHGADSLHYGRILKQNKTVLTQIWASLKKKKSVFAKNIEKLKINLQHKFYRIE